MKPKLSLAIASLVLLFGCSTLTAPDIDRIARATQEAASIGTAEAVRDHPEWRKVFGLIRDQLDAIAAKPVVTVSDLLDAIGKLPVSELSSDTARLAMSGARLLIAIANFSDVEVVQTEQVKPITVALSRGITSGLGTPIVGAESLRAARPATSFPTNGKYYKSK